MALALLVVRPWAAWTLLFPLVLLLAVRVFARPPEVVTGTLELWRELAEARSSRRSSWRLPPWSLVLAAALLCGALAALGPRPAPVPLARTWTMVVDRSASMALPVALPGGPTRGAAALAAARAWLVRTADARDRVRWVASGRAVLETGRDDAPDAAWLAAANDAPEPDWGLHDRQGSLWLTDHRPAVTPALAGLFASGGPAVEGVIASDGREVVVWRDGELHRAPRVEPLRVALDARGGAGPSVLRRVLEAWCGARGVELGAGDPGEALFTLAWAVDGAAEPATLARDGWRAAGEVVTLSPAAGASEDWLSGVTADGGRRTAVRVADGRIEVALRAMEEPSGDPAQFALSWARLFERAARLPREVVPLSEREAAGAPIEEPGRAPPPSSAARRAPGPYVDAALALAAALAAGLAFLLRARSLHGARGG